MKISLIGMSGIGKTHWSKKLAKSGFQKFSIDDLIAEKLAGILQKAGMQSTKDVSLWMGQPYDKQYKDASKQYLLLEEEIMKTVLDTIEKLPPLANVVIDTTGSVIYLSKETLTRLRLATHIVYLKTSPSRLALMYEIYIKDPKPVIWGNIFQPKKGETPLATLARCYLKLLETRGKAYEHLAHTTIEQDTLRNPDFSIEREIGIL